MSSLAEFDALLKQLDESGAPEKEAEKEPEKEPVAIPKQKPVVGIPAAIPSALPSPEPKPVSKSALPEFDALISGFSEENAPVKPVYETLNEVGFKKMTPELAEIAKTETDPLKIKNFPKWFEKTPAQVDIMYDYDKSKPVSESVWEGAESAATSLLPMAKGFVKGAGQIAEIALKNTYTPEELEIRKKRSPLERMFPPEDVQAIKAIAGSIGGTAEQIWQSGKKNWIAGNPYSDAAQEKLGLITPEESRKRYRSRDAIETSEAQDYEVTPDLTARLINSPAGRNTIEAFVSQLSGSVDSIIAENPEMSREEAVKYKEERDASLSKDYIDRAIKYNMETKPTEEMDIFAGFVTPLGNQFSVAGKAFDLAKKTAKLVGVGKGLTEAEKIAIAAERASKQGVVGKAAGWTADKIDTGVEKAQKLLEKLPEPFREIVERKIPLKGMSLTAPVVGGAVGAFEADDGDALWGFVKGAGIGALPLAPRIISDLSKAKAAAGGGFEDMFTRARKMPETSAATRLVSYIPSLKVPFKNESVARWVGDRAANHIKDAVHTGTLAAAIGVYDGADATEMGHTIAEGLLIHYPTSYMHSLVGKNPKDIARENRRQDFENYNVLKKMPESDRNEISSLASFDSVVAQSKKQLDEATAKYAAIPDDKKNGKEGNDLAKEVTWRKAEYEQNLRANPQTRQAYAREVIAAITNNQNQLNGTVFTNRNVQLRVMTTQQIMDHLLSTDPVTGVPRNPNIDPESARAFAENAGATFKSNGQVQLPNGKTAGKPTAGTFFDPLKDTVVINSDKIRQKAEDTGKKFIWVMNHEVDHALQGYKEYQDLTQGLRDELFGKKYVDVDGTTLREVDGAYDTKTLNEMFVNNYLKNKSYKEKADFAKRQGLWDFQKDNLDANAVSKYMQGEILSEARSAGLYGNTRLNSARQNLADWALISHENNLLARSVKTVFGLGGGQSLYTPLTGAKFTPEQMARVRQNQLALERFNGVMSPHDGSDMAPAVKPNDIKNDRVLAEHYAKDDGVFKTGRMIEVVDADGNVISSNVMADSNAYEGEWQSDGSGEVVKTKGFGELPPEAASIQIPAGGKLRVAKHIAYGADGKPVEINRSIRKAQNDQAKQVQRNILLDQTLLDADNPNLGMRSTNAEGTSFKGVPTNKQLEAIFSLPENILPFSIKEKIGIAVGLINDGEGTPTIGTYSARLNSRGQYEAFSPKIHEGVQIGLQFSKDGNWLFTEFNKSGARDKANLLLKYKPDLLKSWNYNVDEFMVDLSQYMKNWKNNPDVGGVPLDPISEQAARIRHKNLDQDFNKAMEKRYIFDAFLKITNKDAAGRANYNPVTIDLPVVPKKKMTKAEKEDAKRSDPSSLIRGRRVDAYSDLKPSAGTKMPLDYGKSLFNAMPEAEIPEMAAKTERYPTSEKGFYSGLQQTIDQKVQGAFASPQQLHAIIYNPQNVRPEELKWSGVTEEIDRLAAENNGKVPKGAVMEYLRNEGAIKFEEVTLGGKEAFDQNRLNQLEAEYRNLKYHPIDDPSFGEDKYDDLITLMNIRDQSTTDTLYSEAERVMALAQQAQRRGDKKTAEKYFRENEFLNTRAEKLDLQGQGLANPPRFAGLQLSGGENYREVVMAMPPSASEFSELLKKLKEKYGEYYAVNRTEEEQAQLEAARNIPSQIYTSSHFPNTPNYVAHMRLNERTDAQGNEGDFIEELQSDRHQAGREKGYAGEGTNELERFEKLRDIPKSERTAEQQKEFDELSFKVINSPSKGIPDAPFRKDWSIQLFKRALRDAVDADKKWIGWTTGDTQAERYDLSKQVDAIDYSIDEDGLYSASAIKGKNEVFSKEGMERSEVEATFGKEIAQKMQENKGKKRETEDGDEYHSLSGLDLKVGGEGMRGFYDQILPKEIGKYVAKMGGKVEKSEIETRREKEVESPINLPNEPLVKIDAEYTPIWRVNITPEMENAVNAGQPQFSPEAEIPFEGREAGKDAAGETKQPIGAIGRGIEAAYMPADSDYLNLAKDPEKNREQLQGMVDVAAKGAGYTTKGFHRTPKAFNEFILGGPDAEAKFWTTKSGEFRTLFGQSGRAIWFGSSPENLPSYHNDPSGNGILLDVYLKNPSPLQIDDDTRNWARDVYADESKQFPLLLSDEHIKSIRNDGYTGIEYWKNGKTAESSAPDEMVVFDPTQIKSADPVTYDDNGNAVPLSQRFNPETSDIRFMPEAEIPSAKISKEKAKEDLKVRMTKEALTDAALSQESWKDWYKEHQDVLDDFFGDHAGLFQEILAVTSQAASVKANVGLALKAFGELMRGEEFDARLRGKEKGGYLDGVIGNLNAIKNKTDVSGRKISNYKAANEGDASRVVVDRHITRLLFGVDTPNKAQYDLAERILTEIANDIGWDPSQVQAALWAHSIVMSGKKPESYGAYLTKLESKPLTKRELASGLTGTQLTKRIGQLAYAGEGSLRSGGGRGRYSPVSEVEIGGVKQIRFSPEAEIPTAQEVLKKPLENLPLRDASTWTEIKEAPIITLKDLIGKKVFPTFADITSAGRVFKGIDSSELLIPIETHGGPEWPLIQPEKIGEEINVWTNQGAGVSTTKVKRAEEGAIMLVTLMDKNAHMSNTEIANAIIGTNSAYARDKRIPAKNLRLLNKKITSEDAFSDFVGIDSPDINEYVANLPFQGDRSRARLATILSSKDAEALGAANVQRILDEMRSPAFEGGRIGDSVIALQLSKGAPVVKLSESGSMNHPSYQYAVRGKVIGKFARPINAEMIYDDFLAQRRADKKPTSGDRRAIDLAKPVQVITKEIANRIPQTPYKYLKSPQHAEVLKYALENNWKDSSVATTKGGISPAEFIDTLNASEAKVALNPYTLDSVKKEIKTGKLKLHQLGDSKVFFGTKNGDPASDYGLNPKDYGFGENEKTLTLVLNGERGTAGMGDAIMMKALSEGVTALDCFAIKNKRYPDGMLPSLYKRFGFETVGEIPFDPQYYTPQKLADIKMFWKNNGWDESTGMPSVVLMKWKGNENDRTRSLRELAGKTPTGIRKRTKSFVRDAAGHSGRADSGQGGSPQGGLQSSDAGRTGGDQGASTEGIQLGGNTIKAIQELLSMKDAELKNLGIDPSQIKAIKSAAGIK